MSLLADELFGVAALDTSSQADASSSGSTPPTTISDAASLHSDASKPDVITVALDLPHVSITSLPIVDDGAIVVAHPESDMANISLAHLDDSTPSTAEPSPGRVRRARKSAPVYNLAKLSGTAIHGKRRANGDIVDSKSSLRRQTIAGQIANGTFSGLSRPAQDTVHQGIDALDLQWSLSNLESPRSSRRHSQPVKPVPRPERQSSRRSAAAAVSAVTDRMSSLGKRVRRPSTKALSNLPRELRQLEDTKEFAGVDDRPVILTVWSNGKFVDPNAPLEPKAKKAKVVAEAEPNAPVDKLPEPTSLLRKPRPKKYLEKGLYAGQEIPKDLGKGLSAAEKKKLASLPELRLNTSINQVMPPPMFTGLRTLIAGRDFKLPFNVCNPLPPGQPKPEEYKKMAKNRFIGESKEYWRKIPTLGDSKCVCKPEDGCGDDCQNRIMLYECDEDNCNVGKEICNNRSFADLTARRNKGGKYRVGVEVVKTSDRGYGVRSNRSFRPNQIIMEYTGEIITEEECERRMNHQYAHNKCYYLMSFDQNMILDATTGSIARFVNHSCNPNCRMIKWIVAGQPRMALFAGDKPIQTGEELTYDYNFDPFSAKNVQKCLCREPNCRGVLGPKTSESKKREAETKKMLQKTVKTGKRKLKELTGSNSNSKSSKKQKTGRSTGVKKSLAHASVKIRSTAAALKKSVSVKVTKGKVSANPTSKSPVRARVIKKTTTKRVVTAFSNAAKKKSTTTKVASTKAPKKSAGSSAKKAPVRSKSISETSKAGPAKKYAPKSKSSPTKKAVVAKQKGPKGKQSRKSVHQPISPPKAVGHGSEGSSIRVVSSVYDDYHN